MTQDQRRAQQFASTGRYGGNGGNGGDGSKSSTGWSGDPSWSGSSGDPLSSTGWSGGSHYYDPFSRSTLNALSQGDGPTVTAAEKETQASPVVVESDNEEWLQAMGEIHHGIIIGPAPKTYAELPNGIAVIVNCQCKELLDTISNCHPSHVMSFSCHSHVKRAWVIIGDSGFRRCEQLRGTLPHGIQFVAANPNWLKSPKFKTYQSLGVI